MASDEIQNLLERIQNEAEAEDLKAGRWGQLNHLAYMVFGLAAIVAGVIAGVSGAAGWAAWLITIAGFAAAILAGAQTFLKTEEKARFHWKRAADFKAIRRDAVITAAEPGATTADVRAISTRLEEVQGREFQAPERPAQQGGP